MKKLIILLPAILFATLTQAQRWDCNLKKPIITIHFGKGSVEELNEPAFYNYSRVESPCPQDGHYSYVSASSNCFGGDWVNVPEDHTPGDANGNMMVVNASYRAGSFFSTTIKGLKPNTTYEFAGWMMNMCRPTEKCPFPLLPDITIRLREPEGKIVMQMALGELQRHETMNWNQYKAVFMTPPGETPLVLSMINSNPGGCGNDLALDDITFRECVKVPPPVATTTKTTASKKPTTTTAKAPVKKETTTVSPPKKTVASTAAPKKQPPPTATAPKKTTNTPPAKKQPELSTVTKPATEPKSTEVPAVRSKVTVFPPAPKVLTTRSNPLVKQIETEAGEISISLYDNGQIDGDTVSIYHNNRLLVSRARLSQEPISFRIKIDVDNPHHELVMVAENLGSIPPNTSVMIVNTGSKKHEVFISSSEQKNAKVVFDLK